MAVDGPQLVYARIEDESALARALKLAREVEELLEETTSIPSLQSSAPSSSPSPASSSSTALVRDGAAHSTRIARAMAAGLVDELEALVRGIRKSGAA